MFLKSDNFYSLSHKIKTNLSATYENFFYKVIQMFYDLNKFKWENEKVYIY